MTLEFAQREAQRRTSTLGTTHYVIYAADSWADEPKYAYLVSNRKPDTERHIVVDTVHPYIVQGCIEGTITL